MTSNLESLKTVSRLALIKEMIERTKECSFVWDDIGPGRFRGVSLPYEFYLTKTGAETAVLDVLKNGGYYRSYNSSTQGEVDELYATVDTLYASNSKVERLNKLTQFVGTIRGCAPKTYNIVMNGGINGSGEALVTKMAPSSFLLLPVAISGGGGSWVYGSVSDLADEPNAASHDGDATYIRQEVSGALPTQWPYVFLKIDVSSVVAFAPLSFEARIVHRREAELGVTMRLDVLVNEGDAVVYTGDFASAQTYTLSTTGIQPMPGIVSLDELTLRISMFTNSGNTAPRALRVSAADITIHGYITS